jgi:hypothetical protein
MNAREKLKSYGFEDHVIAGWTDEECQEHLEAVEMYPEG